MLAKKNKTSENANLERKFYENLLTIMESSLLDFVIMNDCSKYINFIIKNAKSEIAVKKQISCYKMEVSGKEDCSITFSRKDLFLIERLLDAKSSIHVKQTKQELYKILGWEFLKILFERNYKKYISFLKNNIDQDICIETQEKRTASYMLMKKSIL